MHSQRNPVSGHVFRWQRKRGPVWYAKYRLPDGRQVQKRLGPEWTGKGRAPHGYFTKRTAEAALQAILTDARRGTLVGMTQTGATFADAGEEWYRHGEHERGWKPSTRRDYRSALDRHLLPAFRDRPLEAIGSREIEAWRAEHLASGRLTRRTAVKMTAILYGIFERARRLHPGLSVNPVAEVERLRLRYDAGRYDFYNPEEVWALVRAAADDEDAALYVTAAFTGLRMGEVLALRWRDVDFEAEAIRVFGSVDHRAGVGVPKSGKGRTVPMVPDVATVLARLGQRERFTGPEDFVFANATGGYLDNSALRRRYKAAQVRTHAESCPVRKVVADDDPLSDRSCNCESGLRPLRFHDLRHTFGSLAISKGSTRQVQEWLGHADSRTTSRYLHYKPRSDEAALLADAFKVEEPNVATSEKEVEHDRGA
jgi:integrase